MKITMEFARQDDCLDKMVPSDLRQLIGDKQRAEEQVLALAAQVGVLQRSLKVMVERFKPHHETSEAVKRAISALEQTPSACLAHVRAEAVSNLQFPTMLRKMWSGGEVQNWLKNEAERIRQGSAE